LRGPVCQMELEAYRSLNDPTEAIDAGRRALKFSPGNLAVTADLSFILADVATDSQRLDQSEQYARKTLDALKTFTVPKWISPQKWANIKGDLMSEVHASLGMVAFKRGSVRQAIREFETAIDVAPTPEPTEYYRLGRLYQANGDTDAAIQKFRQAATMNDPAIRQLAQQDLKAAARWTALIPWARDKSASWNGRDVATIRFVPQRPNALIDFSLGSIDNASSVKDPLNVCGNLLSAVTVEIHDGHRCAFLREQKAGSFPDSRPASRYNSYFPA
jgi:tetratricopeptide (TPR) repeat protein